MEGQKVLGWEGFRLVTIFKKLKAFIKDWVASQFGSVEQSLASLLVEIQQIDIKEESGSIFFFEEEEESQVVYITQGLL